MSVSSDECTDCKNTTNTQQGPSRYGLYATLGISALAIGGSIAAIPFLTPAMRKHALPYIPATPKQISNVFKSIQMYSQQNNLSNYKVITTTTNNNNNNKVVKLIDLVEMGA